MNCRRPPILRTTVSEYYLLRLLALRLSKVTPKIKFAALFLFNVSIYYYYLLVIYIQSS